VPGQPSVSMDGAAAKAPSKEKTSVNQIFRIFQPVARNRA